MFSCLVNLKIRFKQISISAAPSVFIYFPLYANVCILPRTQSNIFLYSLQSHSLFLPSHHLACSHGRLAYSYTRLGLAISDKKLFRDGQNWLNNWFVPAKFWLFRGTENSRNSVPNRSAEEKNARNSVPWNNIRSKLSEFCSKPFRGREKTTWNTVPWYKNSRKLSEFCSEACLQRKHAVYSVCWSRIFCKTNFFVPFPSVPSLGIDSSVNLGMNTFFRGITEPIPTLLAAVVGA
jgi:hypothetical protein